MALTVQVHPDPPVPGDEVCVTASGPGPGRPTVTVYVNGQPPQPLPSTAETPGATLHECFVVPAGAWQLIILVQQPPCQSESLTWAF